MKKRALAGFASLLLVPLATGCGDDDAGSPSSSAGGGGQSGTQAGGGSAAGGNGGAPLVCPAKDPVVEPVVIPGGTDPEQGVFTIDQALEGLPEGPGPLLALIDTEFGVVTCELRPDKAPNAVANFVGLARGRRAWQNPLQQNWVRSRFYDDLTFHRVIPEFMAQGGDPAGNGTGGPGYRIDDEISDLVHVPGTLAYANSGPDTNGSQFYITEVATPHLDGGYTIFGLCEPLDIVTELTHVPTGANDKPVTPLPIKTVEITRCAP
jgi:peptidyl-prolyl cis-trans isomerase A (cyclophilin A)